MTQSKPSVGGPHSDYTDREGAELLKARIEAYWRERGYDIEVWFVEGSFTMALRASRIDVRSELVNGLPRGPRKPTA